MRSDDVFTTLGVKVLEDGLAEKARKIHWIARLAPIAGDADARL